MFVRSFIYLAAAGAVMLSAPTELQQRRANVLELTNAERKKVSLGDLKEDPLLDKAAQDHAEDMAKRGYFDHNSPNGDGPGDRITRAGFHWNAMGENIFFGPRTAEDAVKGWMHSPGHRRNILNAEFTRLGVGVAKSANGRLYWVQDFGRPSGD